MRFTNKSEFFKLYTKQIGLQPSAVTLFLNTSDSAGILTQDLQNRNLTLYTAKLRSQFGIVDVYVD